MASASAPHSQANRPSRSSLSGIGSANAASHLDKARQDARRSTPDSDVLASSDDELEKQHAEAVAPPTSGPRQTRRSSWLSEIQPPPQRKGSFPVNSPHSPNNSHPASPIADSANWPTGSTSANARGSVATSSFPWGSGIWSPDTRKEPPARLTEVLPSPRSMRRPSGGFPGEIEPLGSPSGRDHSAESTIPFAIPLQPNVKTYRSQSYSVGQLDPDSNTVPPNVLPGAYYTGRGRVNPNNGLQHRPSRPSMLSEFPNDGTSLGRVREAEDDDEEDDSLSGSQQSIQLPPANMPTIESLARENAMLKQEAMTHQLENLQLRNRRASSGGSPYGGHHSVPGVGHRIRGGVPEDAEYAIDEIDDLNDPNGFAAKGLADRRYSEVSADPLHSLSSFAFPPNPKIEVIKKGHWQSSLGFGGVEEGQQSRRHSFAEVPKRSGSISSNPDQQYGLSGGLGGLGRGGGQRTEGLGRYGGNDARASQADNISYFAGTQPSQHGGDHYPQRSPGYNVSDHHGGAHAQSPSAASNPSMFSVPPHLNLSQPRHNQLLYVVTFKCCRAEVFYIQEGTGLQVTPGDLVIVEADRGTDLGTVANGEVSWAKAKELKEGYIEDHYRWLMMFSRHSGAVGSGNGVGSAPLAPSNGNLGSAVGGMGPPGQQNMQEPSAGELKPKMIKRLAQSHEIQTLRDKEANEAKAKRVCQQKVQEHRLQMEILDAEFQMDWKKLTFYYFADAYINFNSLVTDLFKIYKTRIWMSAINPASFATPTTAGLQAPSGIGPGALAHQQRNGQFDQRQQQQESPLYGGLGAAAYRPFQPSLTPHQQQHQSLGENGSERTTPQALTPHLPYAYAFQPFSQPPLRQDRFASPELGSGPSPGYAQYRPGPV